MTITQADSVFPDNAIALIKTRIPQIIDPNLTVLRRSLRPSDPAQSVGVFPLTAVPDQDSVEIQSLQPTLTRYHFAIQTLVRDMEEERAVNVHSILSNQLYKMWYRDAPLHAGLTALSVTLFNSTERMQRRGTTQQRYLSNEVKGTFTFTSWLEAWIETETT